MTINDLENRIALSPWMRTITAVILLTAVGLLVYGSATSPAQIRKRNAKASERFGEALQKAGIRTQESPGKD